MRSSASFRPFVVVVSFALPCALAALAATASAANAADPALEQVVVTATRSELRLPEVGDSITVIDAAAIRAGQQIAVTDLLARTPGVAISRNGGLGTVSALRIRGAEADQTVLLIDGVKLNDPAAPGGGFNFGNLLTDEDSRIEVLRGPQSTLWGSQAIGGVVNIVTPIPTGPTSAALTLEGGARGTGLLRARLQGADDRLAWRVAGSYVDTTGISAFDRNLGGTEKDGYYNAGVKFRAVYQLSDAVSTDIRGSWSKSRSDLDGFPPPNYSFADTPDYDRTDERVAYAGLNISLLDGRLQNRIGYAYTDTARENFDPTQALPKNFDSNGSNRRVEYQGTLALAPGWQAIAGAESERSELRTASPSSFDPNPTPLVHEVQLDSLYAQLHANLLGHLSATAGLRHDHHDSFGGATNGRASLAWTFDAGTILRASFGDGFKAPTLYQLFSEYGNAALAPEEARGWDAGIEHGFAGGAYTVGATWFERSTRNMIDFVGCFGSSDPRCATQPFGFYDNVQRTHARGIEAQFAARIGERLQVDANYTFTDAVNDARGTSNFGRELPRRPRANANLLVAYRWPVGLTTTLATQYAGSAFDNASNSVRLPAYTLVELRASYLLSERTEIFGRIENLLDEQYETTKLYGSNGRGAFVGARLKF
jgi:vitamin B12 transporter